MRKRYGKKRSTSGRGRRKGIYGSRKYKRRMRQPQPGKNGYRI